MFTGLSSQGEAALLAEDGRNAVLVDEAAGAVRVRRARCFIEMGKISRIKCC